MIKIDGHLCSRPTCLDSMNIHKTTLSGDCSNFLNAFSQVCLCIHGIWGFTCLVLAITWRFNVPKLDLFWITFWTLEITPLYFKILIIWMTLYPFRNLFDGKDSIGFYYSSNLIWVWVCFI